MRGKRNRSDQNPRVWRWDYTFGLGLRAYISPFLYIYIPTSLYTRIQTYTREDICMPGTMEMKRKERIIKDERQETTIFFDRC
jgi:hypothetical protein